MNTQIFFSVIIPTYDRKPFLKKAVDSVLTQSYSDLELIVIDDGSSDGTDSLLSSYSDERITYVYQENQGVSCARNKALEIAKGKFIAFLDSDDWWKPEKLSVAHKYIKKYPGIKIFHTNETWFRGGKLLDHKEKHKKPTGRVYRNMLPLCCISMSSSIIAKEVFRKIGAFDEALEACEDYDFLLRATNEYEVKLIEDELTLKDGGRADQLSSSVWGLDRFRITALEKMLSSEKLSKADSLATYTELKKKCDIFALGCEKRGKVQEAEKYRKLATKYIKSQ